jgi:hypothetical protein
MKIPLDMRMYSEGLKSYATVHLLIPGKKFHNATIRGIFWPFVDTGSPYTVMSQTDAERLHITASGTPSSILFGGAELYRYDIKGVVLKVVCDDKHTICDISIPDFSVLRPIQNNSKSIETSKKVPSVIGVDLLIIHKFALYFKPCERIAYLEQ